MLRDRELPEEQRQHSFVLTSPVYGTDDSGAKQFRGWVVMSIRGQDFSGGVLQQAAHNLVDVTVEADTAERTRVPVAKLTSSLDGRRDLQRKRTVQVAQQQWHLQVNGTAAHLPGGSSRQAATVIVSGSLLSALLAALVLVLSTGRERARAHVVAATADLRRSQQDAESQNALLSEILTTISDGVGVVDHQGAFLLHNPAAKQMLGVEEDASTPTAWQEHNGIFEPDGVTPFPVDQLPLTRAVAGESTDGVEMVVRNPNNPAGVIISVSGRALRHDPRGGGVAVFHDITALRQHQRELASFAGVVAHDLKSPLAIIGGYAEILEEDLEHQLPSDAMASLRDTFVRLHGGVERMQQLIDDLLTYTAARDSALHLDDVDLSTLVEEVVGTKVEGMSSQRSDALPPQIHIGELPPVRADAVLLRQIVENLVGNALKYSVQGKPARIDVSATAEGAGWLRVDVADRGIGIPHSQYRSIFASFHRAHPNLDYPGTGLGLAICQRIVERHGGTISATHNPGGGSRFSFTLPITAAPAGSEGNSEQRFRARPSVTGLTLPAELKA